MIVKFSDYVLEQSISDANVSDIMLEQYSAEYNVNMAIANANIKRFMMEAYSDIYQEADSSKPRRSFREWIGNVWERIVNAIKTFFGWIVTKFKQFINWITGKNVEAVAKKAEELDQKLTDQEKEALAAEIVKNNKFIGKKWFQHILKKFGESTDAMTADMDELSESINTGRIFSVRGNLKEMCNKIERTIVKHCSELDSLTETVIKGIKSGGRMFGTLDDAKTNGEFDSTKITKATWDEVKGTLTWLNSIDFKNKLRDITKKCDQVLEQFKRSADQIKSERKNPDGSWKAPISGQLSKVDYEGDDDVESTSFYGAAEDKGPWAPKTGDGAKWFGSPTVKNAAGEDVTNKDAALVDLNGPEVKKLTDLITKLQKMTTESINRFVDISTTVVKACNNVFMNIQYKIRKDTSAASVNPGVAASARQGMGQIPRVEGSSTMRDRDKEEAMKQAVRDSFG